MFPPGARTRHPNGLRLVALDGIGNRVEERTYFSIGGGFIVEDGAEAASGGELAASISVPQCGGVAGGCADTWADDRPGDDGE